MEDIVADMKETEPKQRRLAKAHEAIQAKASSILVFSLQWKDLEVHFNSTRSKIEARFEELRRREELLEIKVKTVSNIDELVVLGKKHLESLALLTKRRSHELDDNDDDKESARVRDCGKKLKLENYCEVIEVKERELSLIVGEIEERRRGLEECEKELKVGEERLSLIQKSIEECGNRRDLDKEARDEVEKKESENEEWAVSLALKEREVNAKAKEISVREMKVKERLREIERREKKFQESKKSLEEGRHHLDMVSKKLQDKEWRLRKWSKEVNLELENRQVNLVEKSSVQHIQGQKSKEENNGEGEVIGDGRGLQLFINEQLKRIDSMCSKTSALLRASEDPAKLVLDAVQGFYRSCSDTDNKEIDFDLQLTRRSCIVLLEELKRISAQISPQVREEATKLAAEWKAKMVVANENRSEIIGFLELVTTFQLTSFYDANELCSLIASIAHPKQAAELCQALGVSNKAAESSISLPVNEEEQESKLAKNAVTLSSSDPHPNATGHATNSPGFLHEQLIWNLSIQNKIFGALQKSSDSDPAKLLLDLMQVSFAGYLTKGEARLEETSMKSFISLLETVSRVQLQLGPQVKEDAIELAVRWKAKLRADTENSLEILGFLQFIATYGLCFSFIIEDIANLVGMTSECTHTVELCQKLGFVNLIPDIIPNLIQKEQLFSAVILTCTFKLTDKIPPAPLLHKYVDEAWNHCTQNCLTKISLDDKVKVIDSQIAELRAVIRCIKKYNLESEYQSAAAEIRMDELEKLKENWRLSAPTFISGYPQSSPSSVLPTNYGQLGPFGMPANSLQAANYGELLVPTRKLPYR